MIRGIRGAVTVEEDRPELIHDAVIRVVRDMADANDLHPEQVAQVIITMTEDLTSTFPAGAVRKMEGWQFVPVMCAQEIPVPGSMEKCIRLMVTAEVSVSQAEVQHVYHGKAASLRPDLKAEQRQ
ncbi:chorismate mutase [Alkalicoccus chagannorensis]|uniref:chorismate mutase n=1 Tax=Alkalicoccus chagannorensis TaxID=427072 RepID=UPI0003FAFFAE|nr:chorismate mutase [Alkalicoccus chagannorensis]